MCIVSARKTKVSQNRSCSSTKQKKNQYMYMYFSLSQKRREDSTEIHKWRIRKPVFLEKTSWNNFPNIYMYACVYFIHIQHKAGEINFPSWRLFYDVENTTVGRISAAWWRWRGEAAECIDVFGCLPPYFTAAVVVLTHKQL